MATIADRLVYNFYAPEEPSPSYNQAVILLANSPGLPLHIQGEYGVHMGPMGRIAERVANATGSLVCAYERPGSTEGQWDRELRQQLTPGEEYEGTLGQTARVLSEAISSETEQRCKQILLAGHSLGANFSLDLANQTHEQRFPISNLALIKPVRGNLNILEKAWHVTFYSRVFGHATVRAALADARLYMRSTNDTTERIEQMATGHPEISFYAQLPVYSIGLELAAKMEKLQDYVNTARESRGGSKESSAEPACYSGYYSADELSAAIARGFGGRSRQRRH